MMEKLIFAAGVIALVIQGNDSIPSTSTNHFDDFEQRKEAAFELISKTHEQLSSDFGERVDYAKNSYDKIMENKEMEDRMVQTGDVSVDEVQKMVQEMKESGEEEGKTNKYFQCLEDKGGLGIANILGEVESYKYGLRTFQTTALDVIANSLYSMEKIFKVAENAKNQIFERIDECEDTECVLIAVEDAEYIFNRGDSLVTSRWNKSVGAWFRFKDAARKKLTKAEETVSKLLEDTLNELRTC